MFKTYLEKCYICKYMNRNIKNDRLLGYIPTDKNFIKNIKKEDGEIQKDTDVITKTLTTNNIFSELSLDCQLIESYQKRNNYLYKGVEIALKYSNHWGFHIELEIVIDDIKLKKDAEKKIHAVAKELNIKLMNDVELEEFVNKLEKDVSYWFNDNLNVKTENYGKLQCFDSFYAKESAKINLNVNYNNDKVIKCDIVVLPQKYNKNFSSAKERNNT